jgi:hypothetical protein
MDFFDQETKGQSCSKCIANEAAEGDITLCLILLRWSLELNTELLLVNFMGPNGRPK